MCRGVSCPYGSRAGRCCRGAKGHAGPHSYPGMLLATTSQPRRSPDGHPDLQRATEALCQPRTHTHAPLGHRAQPCLSPRECPATLRVPRSPCSPEHPRPPGLRVPVPALGEPRAVRGQDPPTPFRPVPSRLACSVPALLRSASARHGTARLGSAQVSALPPGTARIGPDRTDRAGAAGPSGDPGLGELRRGRG